MQKLRTSQPKGLMLLLLGFFYSAIGLAMPVTSNYSFEAVVAEKSQKTKIITAKAGISNILTKTTGEIIPSSKLPNKIEPFIDAFYYTLQNDELTLTLRFNPSTIDKYLKTLKKQAWLNKPKVLVWPFEHQGNTFSLQSATAPPSLLPSIIEDSQKRALPLLFPEIGLELIETFSNYQNELPSLVSQVLKASPPYDTDFVIIYVLEPLPNNETRLKASLFHHKGLIYTSEKTDSSETNLITNTMNELILEIKKHAYTSEQQISSYLININNINSPLHYNQLQTYLQNLKEIDTLKLENLSENSITFQVQTKLARNELLSLLKKNKTIYFIEQQKNALSFSLLS